MTWGVVNDCLFYDEFAAAAAAAAATNHITSAISIIGEKVFVGAKISIFCHHHIKVLLVSKQLLVLWLLCG
jgi:ATP-dependent protease HslVU (ClpYQ) peptidase subunit